MVSPSSPSFAISQNLLVRGNSSRVLDRVRADLLSEKNANPNEDFKVRQRSEKTTAVASETLRPLAALTAAAVNSNDGAEDCELGSSTDEEESPEEESPKSWVYHKLVGGPNPLEDLPQKTRPPVAPPRASSLSQGSLSRISKQVALLQSLEKTGPRTDFAKPFKNT